MQRQCSIQISLCCAFLFFVVVQTSGVQPAQADGVDFSWPSFLASISASHANAPIWG